MKNTFSKFTKQALSVILFFAFIIPSEAQGTDGLQPEQHGGSYYIDVRDFGATGSTQQSCHETTKAIQAAIDQCAGAGGGMVYVGPGEYVTGPINLRSNVYFYIESGATLFGSRDASDWPRGRRAILFGDSLNNVTIGGGGTIDGNAEHAQFPYAEKQDAEIQYRMDALIRDGVEGMPFWTWTRPVYNLVYLRNCTDIRMTGVKLLNSPVWCVHFLACDRVVVDGVYIYSSLINGVNSDGINPNGCRDVRISNCTIETGDDCISLKSGGSGGIQRSCENITITNCRLTSASSAVKIGDEIDADVSHVLINNCVIRDSHRAFAFMIIDGGTVSDVIISNITIECSRHDWFWWGQGDAFYFKIARRNENSPIGRFENILIKDVIAHVKGSSILNGHPENPITGIRLENVKLFMSEDPGAYFREAVHAIQGRYFKDLTLKDISVTWEEPGSDNWKSALFLEDVDGLVLDGFIGKQAFTATDEPAVVMKNVGNAIIRNCLAPEGTSEFLRFEGVNNRNFTLLDNDFFRAQKPIVPLKLSGSVITFMSGNRLPE